MAFCHDREDLSRDEVVQWCRRDRDELSEKMMSVYPEFEGQAPSAWVEDLIFSLCGFRVHDYPLPKGQLGLCDVANKLILLNSEMSGFVGKSIDLKALRTSTLGHELGHVRMHSGELEALFVSRHGRWERVRDARLYQRETEANLYAAVFLVPGNMLVRHPRGLEIYNAWKERRALKPGWLRKLVQELAADFGVVPAVMRRSLEERRWLDSYHEVKTYRIRLGSTAFRGL